MSWSFVHEKVGRCFFVTISLRFAKASHLSSRQYILSDLVAYCGHVFLCAGKGGCKENSCGKHHLNMNNFIVGCFFQAVEEWLQPMIMFGIPRCNSLLSPFVTLFSLKDHLVKLLLLGDSAVGKFLPQIFEGHFGGFPPCCRHNEELFRSAHRFRSSLLMRFCESKFDANFVLTIGWQCDEVTETQTPLPLRI